MSHSTELKPLAMLKDGRTLCTTPAQDRYFVVERSGASAVVDLPTACKLYRGAKEIVWGGDRRRPPKEARGQAKPRPTETWKNEMRKALQRIDEGSKSGS